LKLRSISPALTALHSTTVAHKVARTRNNLMMKLPHNNGLMIPPIEAAN